MDAVEHPARPLSARVRQLALTAAMALAALNIWTGSPLFALWVGSQFQGEGPPKMSSVAVVVVVMTITSLSLVWLLGRLGSLHDELTGVRPRVSAHVPWLRSMRAEREFYPDETIRLTALERVLVVMVVVVVLVFEVWFLLFSSSPMDERTGRTQAVPSPDVPAAPLARPA